MKLWPLIKNIIFFCCSKEYQLKLESYLYCEKRHSYFLTFRVRGKKIFRVINIEDFCRDENLLSMIHPVDAYITGIIYAMNKNKIILESNIMDRFMDYDSYVIFKPFLHVEYHCMDNDDLIWLKSKDKKESLKVPIFDFYEKSFLLQAIGSVASNRLGFFTSEKFIMEIN
jgi:hypothetical protein